MDVKKYASVLSARKEICNIYKSQSNLIRMSANSKNMRLKLN